MHSSMSIGARMSAVDRRTPQIDEHPSAAIRGTCSMEIVEHHFQLGSRDGGRAILSGFLVPPQSSPAPFLDAWITVPSRTHSSFPLKEWKVLFPVHFLFCFCS